MRPISGRRIKKSIDWDGAGAGTAEEIQYIYDGDHIALALDSSDEVTNRYLHAPAIDMILADDPIDTAGQAGDNIWLLADNLGSIRDIVDSSGTVVNHLTYNAFGEITEVTDDTADHIFAFTGRERDEESDLQFNRARCYDSAVGRWISEEPIGFNGGDSNLARYVANAPNLFADPSGMEGEPYLSQDGVDKVLSAITSGILSNPTGGVLWSPTGPNSYHHHFNQMHLRPMVDGYNAALEHHYRLGQLLFVEQDHQAAAKAEAAFLLSIGGKSIFTHLLELSNPLTGVKRSRRIINGTIQMFGSEIKLVISQIGNETPGAHGHREQRHTISFL